MGSDPKQAKGDLTPFKKKKIHPEANPATVAPLFICVHHPVSFITISSSLPPCTATMWRSPPPPPTLFLILLAISAVRSHQLDRHVSQSRKLVDDSIDQSKCGGCPCGNPCPTTPIYPPPPPPPPPRKTPSTSGGYCPPPPSPPSNFIYITGPPGSLYPVDQTYGAASSRRFAAAMWAAVGGGVVAILFLFHQF